MMLGTALSAALALALSTGSSKSPPNALPAAQSASTIKVVNIADEFLAFWDSTAQLSTTERVAIFKRDVVPLFPEFYGVERFGGKRTPAEQDALIAARIENFAELRNSYAEKVSSFQHDLASNIETFIKAFPDFNPHIPIYLVHSLGEMDGGMRTLAGQDYLIFGADVMTRVHPFQDESAFFHHELFHVHHSQSFACSEVWCTLWTEGLAVYAAQKLNPNATEAQLLLDFPPGMVAATEAKAGIAWKRAEESLRSTDRDVLAALFQARPNDNGLPPRHGYYLGYVIASELGKTRDLRQLTSLNEAEAWPLVLDTVKEMRRRHATP